MATILIVEDHAMSRQILVTLLEFAGPDTGGRRD